MNPNAGVIREGTARVSMAAVIAMLAVSAASPQENPADKRPAFEVATADVNTLVVDRADGKLGPKVKEWDGTCRIGKPSEDDDPAVPRCPSGYRAGGITLDGATMFSAGEVLSLPQARPLLGNITVDQTGLKGRYTMELDYPFAPPRPADPAAPVDLGVPSLPTAIREQWGLRVVRGQGPFRVAVIESAQLPPSN